MFVCISFICIIVNYVFGDKMIFSKVVVHESTKVSDQFPIYRAQGRSLNLGNSRISIRPPHVSKNLPISSFTHQMGKQNAAMSRFFRNEQNHLKSQDDLNITVMSFLQMF